MADADPRHPEPGSDRPGESREPEQQAEEPSGETDGTIEHPRWDDTAEQPGEPPAPVDPWVGSDETVVGGGEPHGPGPGPGEAGPTGTGILPAVPGEPQAPPRWSARAHVPAPAVGEEYGQPEWQGEPPRSVLVPALIAAGAVILLALVGLGLWLALRGPSTPITPTTTTPRTTPAATTTAPATTTPPPTTTHTTTAPPTTTVPATIKIPDLSGKTPVDAASALRALGLTPRTVSTEPSTTVPQGQVIRTDPAAGTAVTAGSPVDLVVSSGSPTPTSPAHTS